MFSKLKYFAIFFFVVVVGGFTIFNIKSSAHFTSLAKTESFAACYNGERRTLKRKHSRFYSLLKLLNVDKTWKAIKATTTKNRITQLSKCMNCWKTWSLESAEVGGKSHTERNFYQRQRFPHLPFWIQLYFSLNSTDRVIVFCFFFLLCNSQGFIGFWFCFFF